jgi:hypothetical protein
MQLLKIEIATHGCVGMAHTWVPKILLLVYKYQNYILNVIFGIGY